MTTFEDRERALRTSSVMNRRCCSRSTSAGQGCWLCGLPMQMKFNEAEATAYAHATVDADLEHTALPISSGASVRPGRSWSRYQPPPGGKGSGTAADPGPRSGHAGITPSGRAKPGRGFSPRPAWPTAHSPKTRLNTVSTCLVWYAMLNSAAERRHPVLSHIRVVLGGSEGSCRLRARPPSRCAGPRHRHPRGSCRPGSAPAARAANGPARRAGPGSSASARDRPPAFRSCRWAARAKSSAMVASGAITRSTEEWRDSRSCHRATFSSAGTTAGATSRARPVRFSDRTGLRLCGIADEPFWPGEKYSSASPDLGALKVADLQREALDRRGDDAQRREEHRRAGRAG